MFQVVWLKSAREEVARAWVQASSNLRMPITDAVARIDRSLIDDATDFGESRTNVATGLRIGFEAPLSALVEVRLNPDVATVIWVRVYRKRP